MRAFALVSLVLLAGYQVLRLAATGCVGSGCDVYIPFSALLPLAVWVTAVLAGALGVAAVRRDGAPGSWRGLMVAAAVLSAVGPLLCLVLFRDAPDTFVRAATILVVLAPLMGLAYGFARRATGPPRSS